MTPDPFPFDINIEEMAWANDLPDAEEICAKCLATLQSTFSFEHEGEISVAFISNDRMQALNRDYRGKDKPTNVLSFPDHGPAPILGDIIMAHGVVVDEAQKGQISLRDHVSHLFIHGFLHLQGYDHETDPEAEIMEAMEVKALAALNIDNPYKINERNSS